MGRFATLVNTLEGIENFKDQYNIPLGVSIQHCLQGEWQALRSGGGSGYPYDCLYRGRGEDPYGESD